MFRYGILLVTFMLTACGFAPDKPNTDRVPETMALVSGQAGRFEAILQQQFAYRGTLLIVNTNTQPLALVIRQKQEYERYVGEGSVTLTIEITALVTDLHGKTIVFPETFVKEATVQYKPSDDANKRLMIDSQKQLIYNDIASNIYSFLASKNLNPAS